MKYNESKENSLGGGGDSPWGTVGAFHIKCIRWKIFEQTGIGMAYLHVFLIAMHGIDTAAGVYVEPFQTNMLELFCENS